jgi:endonuclease/exonuclease/phosphatase family metal-dependent hydrolase
VFRFSSEAETLMNKSTVTAERTTRGRRRPFGDRLSAPLLILFVGAVIAICFSGRFMKTPDASVETSGIVEPQQSKPGDEAAKRFSKTLTIACWNVENMFHWLPDSANPESNKDRPTEEVARLKLKKDAEVIKKLDADVVGLVEVENQRVLDLFCDEYLRNLGYRYRVTIDGFDPRGIDTAIISRRPFMAQSFQIDGFARGILACRFTIDGRPFYVLVNHWKSRRVTVVGEDTQTTRLKCADRTAKLVADEIPGYEGGPTPIVVMGDLNDDDGDKSVRSLVASASLFNTLADRAPTSRWTNPYYNRERKVVELSGFDHAIVNQAFRDDRGIEWISSSIAKPKEMLNRRTYGGVVYDWPDRDTSSHVGYSDHLPVVVKIGLKKE